MCSRNLLYPRNMSVPYFSKVFGLGDIPNDWELLSLSVDWFGLPLLLFREGKPQQPDFHREREAWSRWYKTPPKAHHVVYQEAGKVRSVAFDHSQAISTFHVQRSASPRNSGLWFREKPNQLINESLDFRRKHRV